MTKFRCFCSTRNITMLEFYLWCPVCEIFGCSLCLLSHRIAKISFQTFFIIFELLFSLFTPNSMSDCLSLCLELSMCVLFSNSVHLMFYISTYFICSIFLVWRKQPLYWKYICSNYTRFQNSSSCYTVILVSLICWNQGCRNYINEWSNFILRRQNKL